MSEVRYRKCPTTQLSITFTNTTTSTTSPPIVITCRGRPLDPTRSAVALNELWYSGDTLETSEAVCVRTWCETSEQAACATRILPRTEAAPREENRFPQHDPGRWLGHKANQVEAHQVNTRKNPPNVLIIKFDGLSRQRFKRMLVKTNRLIQRLNFISFRRYTPLSLRPVELQNSNASGIPMANKTASFPWILETLRSRGYVTFRAKNECVRADRKGHVASFQADHGEAIGPLVCFDFQRPNCVGGKSAAEHLLDYGMQFIRWYEAHKQTGSRMPWAAMIELGETMEDTLMLGGTLDEPVWRFLYSLYQSPFECTSEGLTPTEETLGNEACTLWNHTAVLLISGDERLQIGPYSSTSKGLQEYLEPILHVHLPASVPASAITVMEENKDIWTTPLDVHETIFDILVTEDFVDERGKVNSLIPIELS